MENNNTDSEKNDSVLMEELIAIRLYLEKRQADDYLEMRKKLFGF